MKQDRHHDEFGRPVLINTIAASLNLAAGLTDRIVRLHLALHVALFVPQNGFRHFLRMQTADKPFRGLYTWNGFDAALLIPYFAVMILLAIYGVHRYTMVYL